MDSVDDDDKSSTQPRLMRLLPWTTPEGKPCFLHGAEQGFLWRMADETEGRQLAFGADVLSLGREVLDDPELEHDELNLLAGELINCLAIALRIAGSRGLLLAAKD